MVGVGGGGGAVGILRGVEERHASVEMKGWCNGSLGEGGGGGECGVGGELGGEGWWGRDGGEGRYGGDGVGRYYGILGLIFGCGSLLWQDRTLVSWLYTSVVVVTLYK